MTENTGELQDQLADLAEHFSRLGTTVLESSRAMQEAGTPPPEALVRHLTALRGAFVDLRTRLIEHAGGLGVKVAQTAGAMISLADLEPLLRAIADAETTQAAAEAPAAPAPAARAAAETPRAPTEDAGTKGAVLEAAVQRAVSVLNRVGAIGHRDDPTFKPLLECRAKANALRQGLWRLVAENPNGSVTKVDQAMLPFADLLTLVTGREDLDDERWSQLEESVVRTFGRALALAATRGRLVIEGAQSPGAPAEAPRAPEPAAPRQTLRLTPAAPPAWRPAAPAAAPAPAAPPPPPVAPRPAPAMAAPPPAPPPVAPRPAPAMAAPPARAEPAMTAPPFAQRGAAAADPPEPGATVVPWFAAARDAWRAWKSTGMAAAHAIRAALVKHPHLLSVPIQESAQHDSGQLAAGYFMLLEHVEGQSPTFIRQALKVAIEQAGGSMDAGTLGPRLYALMTAKGRLQQTYPDFVRDIMVTAIPNPGLWVDAGIVENDDATVIVTHPGAVGDATEQSRRLTEPAERLAVHRFAVTVAPLTARFFSIKRGDMKDPRDVHVKLTAEGEPSDAGWLLPLRTDHLLHAAPKRPPLEGVNLEGFGQNYGGLWVALFNVEPAGDKRLELVLTVKPQGTPAPARRSSFGAPARPR